MSKASPIVSERGGTTESDTEFRMGVKTTGSWALVDVAGDLDLRSAPELRELLTALEHDGVEAIVIDLSDATFLDSMALGVLLGAKKRRAALGGALEIVVPKHDLRRIFEITMLDRIFDLHASRAEAAEACHDRATG